MKKKYHPMKIRNVFLLFALSLLLAASLACGFSAGEPTPTITPVPPTPVPPTATPTSIPPTPTPALIPGIDEPIVVEGVNLQLLDAYIKDSLDSQSGTRFPDNPDDVFFILNFTVASFEKDDWIAMNSTISCDNNAYKAIRLGFYVGDEGRLEYWYLILEVPQGLDFEKCVFQINKYEIELSTFFE